jgi:hypothetical protein
MERRDIILLLLKSSAGNEGGITGTTRLQKSLFLVEKEGLVKPTDEQFDFIPYKYGPASKRLYDDLEFLTNLELITRSDQKAFEIEAEPKDIDELSAEELLTDQEEASDSPQNEDGTPENAPGDSVVYRLTDKGMTYLRDNTLLDTKESQAVESIKRKYSHYALTELLSYIYSKYPDYIVESEIRDRFGA